MSEYTYFPCWRCGILIRSEEGELLTVEHVEGTLLAVHEMCRDQNIRSATQEDDDE